MVLVANAGCGSTERTAEAPDQPTDAETWPELYAAFPADSEFLAGLSLQSVRESGLWTEYGPELRAALDEGEDLARAREACGFDPLEEVENLLVGGSSRPDGDVVFAIQGISKSELEACVEGVAETGEGELAVTEDDGLSRYEVGDISLVGGWIGHTTLVAGPEGEVDREALARRTEGDGGLAPDSPLAALVDERVDRDAGLWVGAIPAESSEIGQELAAAGDVDPEAIYATLAPTDVLDIDVGLELRTAGEAEELRASTEQILDLVRLQAGDLGDVLETLELRAEKEYMTAALSLTPADIELIVEEVQAMIGGALTPSAEAGPSEGGPAPADPGMGQAQPPGMDEPVSDEEIDAFVEAHAEVEKVQEDLEAELMEAESDEFEDLQNDAIDQIREVVEDTGMEFENYGRIAQRLRHDPELLEDVEAALEVQSEGGGEDEDAAAAGDGHGDADTDAEDTDAEAEE